VTQAKLGAKAARQIHAAPLKIGSGSRAKQPPDKLSDTAAGAWGIRTKYVGEIVRVLRG
jgi:hypothetical protein